MFAQTAKDDSVSAPLQHQFELPVDYIDDVEMFSMPASPYDKEVLPKTQGVM